VANQQMSGGTKILIGCLAVVGLLFVGGIIAVIVAFSTFASWGPPLLASGAKQMIKQSNLPQAEKQGVIKQIDQLMQEFDSGKISGDDLQKMSSLRSSR